MKKSLKILSVLTAGCIGFCVFMTGCTTTISSGNKNSTTKDNSSVVEAAEKNLRIPTPTNRTEKDPQVLVH